MRIDITQTDIDAMRATGQPLPTLYPSQGMGINSIEDTHAVWSNTQYNAGIDYKISVPETSVIQDFLNGYIQ